MRIKRFLYQADWDQGVYNGTSLDQLVNVSPWQHPAIIPGSTITSQRGDSGAALALLATSPNPRAIGGTNPPTAVSFGNAYTSVPNDVVNLYVDTTTTGGTFQLVVNNQVSAAITYSTTAATTVTNVQTALNTLLGGGNVTVASVSALWYTLTFSGSYNNRAVNVVAQNVALTSSGMTVVPPWIVSPTWTMLDHLALTMTAGDYLQFTVPATCQQLTIYPAGILASGLGSLAGANLSAPATSPAQAMTGNNTYSGNLAGIQSGTVKSGQVRNGAVAIVQVDGVTKGVLDTWQSTIPLVLYGLTGNNVIRIYHSGSYNVAFAPWTTPVNAVNTGASNVAGHMAISALLQPSFVTAMWQIVIVDGTHYKIQKNTGTPEAPSYTDVAGATTIVIGTADTMHVPGLSVNVLSGSTFTAGDSATFRTEASMLAISAIVMGMGTNSAAGSYGSAVIDSGDSSTQWFLAEWTEPAGGQVLLPGTGFTFEVGNTPSVDLSWIASYVTPVETVLSTTERRGTAGLTNSGNVPPLPRGRYGRVVFNFTSSAVPPYVRDLYLYYWTPESEPMVMPKLGLAPNWQMGPHLSQIVGTWATFFAATRAYYLDFAGSASIGGAVDQWLAGYGHDLSLVETTGIPPSGFRAIVQAAFKNHAQGGSNLTTQQLVALLVLGPSGSPSAITVTTTAVYAYTVTIPAPSLVGSGGQLFYVGLPGVPTGPGSLARTIITNFVNQIGVVGSSPTISFL